MGKVKLAVMAATMDDMSADELEQAWQEYEASKIPIVILVQTLMKAGVTPEAYRLEYLRPTNQEVLGAAKR